MDVKSELIDLLIQNKAVGFFDPPVILKSGAKSSWYVNWRRITDNTKSAQRLAGIIARAVENEGLNPDSICGVPEGATKAALLATMEFARIKNEDKFLLAGRGKPKEHGAPSDRYFLGPTDISVVLLEDVVTSGGSLIEFIDRCKTANIKVLAAVSLTNRQPKSERDKLHKKLDSLGVKFMPLLLAIDLLPRAIESIKPPEGLRGVIDTELKKLEE